MLVVGITSAGSGVGSAVLRSLALSSLEVEVVALDVAPDATGIHRGDRGRLVPSALAPHFGEAILRVCAEEGIQALIPGLDTELEPLSLLAGPLRELGCHLLCAAPEPIRLLRDKLRCSDHFRALGLPFVPTLPLSGVEEILDLHGFPLLVKPLAGSGSRGVHVVFNTDELKSLLEEVRKQTGVPYIVQPYLVPSAWGRPKGQLRHGDVYHNHVLVQKNELMVQVLLDAEGVPFGVMTSQNALKDGAIARMEPIEADTTGATDAALRMAAVLAGIGLVGPCNFQSRATDEGPFFYEINPRFSGGTGGRASLGFNEVEASLRRLVLGESTEEVGACLKTRYDQVCAWHPMELVMEKQVFGHLAGGRTIIPRERLDLDQSAPFLPVEDRPSCA